MVCQVPTPFDTPTATQDGHGDRCANNRRARIPEDRPHIMLIMTDQQRFDTVGAWGNDHMITPNMDRLAREGISFRQAFCPGATCVASRVAIFTGMYPHTTGVYSFDPWGNHWNWVDDLADNGYFCVNIGKMHFRQAIFLVDSTNG